MTEHHSTTSTPTSTPRKTRKPKKPYPDFPLFPHATKRWAKKIRCKLYYFGPWDDPDGALAKYEEQREALYAGRPVKKGDACTVRHMANAFMNSKRQLVANEELKQRTWNELYSTCQRIVKTFGEDTRVIDLGAEDFEKLRAEMAAAWGPVRLGNEIQRVRSVFKYAYEASLIPQPIRFGPAFKRPSKKVLRKLRSKRGPRMFEAKEILAMLDAANVQLRAMILLGINVGYGNEDCAVLPIDAIDLAGGWATFPRPKTAVERRAKLWPETVEAIRQVLAARRTPVNPDHAGILFITQTGQPWGDGAKQATALAHEVGKLLVGLEIKKPGLNFYGLRHSFRTVADGCRDQPAIDHVMGHSRDADMSTHYRERIEDSRLADVAAHVRAWLFKKPKKVTMGENRKS